MKTFLTILIVLLAANAQAKVHYGDYSVTGDVKMDTIDEYHPGEGVTIEGVQIIDGAIPGISGSGAWSATTTYALEDIAVSGTTAYISLQDDNLNHDVSDGLWWSAVAGAGGSGDMLKATYDLDDDGLVDYAKAGPIEVRKGSAGTITIGQPIYQSGYSTYIEVELADASSSTTLPCIGLAAESIDSTADAKIVSSGILEGLNTSSWTGGDLLYISTTAG